MAGVNEYLEPCRPSFLPSFFPSCFPRSFAPSHFLFPFLRFIIGSHILRFFLSNFSIPSCLLSFSHPFLFRSLIVFYFFSSFRYWLSYSSGLRQYLLYSSSFSPLQFFSQSFLFSHMRSLPFFTLPPSPFTSVLSPVPSSVAFTLQSFSRAIFLSRHESRLRQQNARHSFPWSARCELAYPVSLAKDRCVAALLMSAD